MNSKNPSASPAHHQDLAGNVWHNTPEKEKHQNSNLRDTASEAVSRAK